MRALVYPGMKANECELCRCSYKEIKISLDLCGSPKWL